MIRRYWLLGLLALVSACSQQSTKPAAVAFHNLNAKYNAIWQADRLKKSLQKKFWEEHKEDYKSMLPIIPAIDSSFGQQHATDIDLVIKKASLVIDRHQNSHFVDDAYTLIGWGRYIKKDYKNALETFKFVNSIDNDPRSQSTSLIHLYQIYIHQHDFTSAEKVGEFIQSLDLSQTQKNNYLLSRAYYHQSKKELIPTIALLEEIIPSLSSGEEKARLYYILGQLFESQGKNQLALESYAAVKKSKASYELQFHATLAVHQLNNAPEELKKMIREPKNEDHVPALYAALGEIYFKNKEFDKAKEYWTKGGKSGSDRGELYLQLGNLFAKQLKRFDDAAKYYDSAATYMSPNHAAYASTQKLKTTWSTYLQLSKAVSQEDSLLKLSNMSLAELTDMYQKTQKKQQRKADSILTKNVPVQSTVIFTRRPASPEQQSFYFNNDQARIQGQQEFSNKWGLRTLEDFWNRKNKNNNLTNRIVDLTQNTSNASSENIKASNDNPVLSDSLQIWLNTIPKSPAQVAQVKKREEDALFELGKFVRLELGEKEQASILLKKLLTNYPGTSHEAEALYLLYLSSDKDSPAQKNYRSQLFDRFPTAYFKQLILKIENGSLTETNELAAQKAYELAYGQFKANNYSEASRQCQQILQQFPGSNLEDKVVFLKALCYGGLKEFTSYQDNLKNFILAFPKSPLTTEAEALLKAYTKNKN